MRVTKGDYRQLADALFHSGTGPGVVSEYKDAPNRLHFYVLGKKRDASGVLSYRVAVRSLDGAGPATRGIAVSEANASPASPGRVAIHRFRVTNTGAAEDLIRVRTTTAGGWTTTVGAKVLDVPAGSAVTVPVYVTVPSDERGQLPTTLKFTASSETDPAASASRTATVTPARER